MEYYLGKPYFELKRDGYIYATPTDARGVPITRPAVKWSEPVTGPAPDWQHGKCMPIVESPARRKEIRRVPVTSTPEGIDVIRLENEEVYAPIPDWALVNNIRS